MFYFISDTHFGHEKIIEYCHRPFKNVEEMDTTLIRNWNERVSDEDTVFFLGDFCLIKSSEAPNSKGYDYYRSQLKGNIIFFKGNHDGNNKCKTIIESMTITHGGKKIYLTHNPKFALQEFRWNFCGHTHGNEGVFKKFGHKSLIIDLSVDCWEFKPVNINDICKGYSEWYKRGQK